MSSVCQFGKQLIFAAILAGTAILYAPATAHASCGDYVHLSSERHFEPQDEAPPMTMPCHCRGANCTTDPLTPQSPNQPSSSRLRLPDLQPPFVTLHRLHVADGDLPDPASSHYFSPVERVPAPPPKSC